MSRISCICSVGKAQALANAPSHPELGVTQPSSDLWLYKTSNGSSGEGQSYWNQCITKTQTSAKSFTARMLLIHLLVRGKLLRQAEG